jgi:hypothetical protein
MTASDLAREIVATYRKHGWQLNTVLLRPQTMAEFSSEIEAVAGDAKISESLLDALWFSRPSPNGGEAWELRLLAETPYALFQRIEPNESEDQRTQVLRSMEERLIEYLVAR